MPNCFFCVFSVSMREEKGCEYRTTPARLKGTAVLSPRGVENSTTPSTNSNLHEVCSKDLEIICAECRTQLLSPPTRPMEPNVGRPKGLGNISDIRCRICRHWFIIARAGLCSVFSVRVHLNNVWASPSSACRHPCVLLGPASFLRDPRGAHRARVFGCRLHLC